MSDGYVYIVGSDELGHLVKIGWSDAPERRLKSLQTGSPYRLKLRDKHAGQPGLERFLHAEFSERRVQGEWFDFGNEDALPLIAEAVQGWVVEVKANPASAYTFDEPGLLALPERSDMTPADQVLALYVHVPRRRGGALRWTRQKMAAYLGVSLRTVATAIKHLTENGLLVEAERHGSLIYYQVNPDQASGAGDG